MHPLKGLHPIQEKGLELDVEPNSGGGLTCLVHLWPSLPKPLEAAGTPLRSKEPNRRALTSLTQAQGMSPIDWMRWAGWMLRPLQPLRVSGAI